MTLLPYFLVLAFVGSPSPANNGVESLTAPGLSDPTAPLAPIPEIQASPECPVASCLVGPVSLTREQKAPRRQTSEFSAIAGQEAELVFVTSDRKRTTVKAWLNGETVLLPSALARSRSNEVRIPVTVAEENVLEVRLTAKPGTEVRFWIEGEAATPALPPAPEPTIEFRLSNASVGPTATMNAVCSADFGPNFEIADWADVVAGVDPTPIERAGTAWIQRDGLGSFSMSFFGPTYHYLVSAIGNVNPTYHFATIEPDLFWLNALDGGRRVLCKGPSS